MGGKCHPYLIISNRSKIIGHKVKIYKTQRSKSSVISKIVSETKKLPGYLEKYKPEFISSTNSFVVILKSVNYYSLHSTAYDTAYDSAYDTAYDTAHDAVVLTKKTKPTIRIL